MPAPSRLEEAKQVLLDIYAETGGMPSIAAFAKAMGYSSVSSAHDVAKALIKAGFLNRADRGGRLLPGPAFVPRALGMPPELESALPLGKELRVLQVPDDSLQSSSILRGDHLVMTSHKDAGLEPLVLSKGGSLQLSQAPKAGWKVEGRLVLQFRSYREAGTPRAGEAAGPRS
jgi:hypothetical protein